MIVVGTEGRAICIADREATMTRTSFATAGLVAIVMVAASCQQQGGGTGSQGEALGTTKAALNSVPVYQDPTGSQSINQPSGTSFSVNQLSNANSVIFVDGGTYARTGAGIQAAINAAPAGGTVFLPPATYSVGPSDLPVVISQPVNLVGAGWGTVLSVSNETTTDVLVVQPAAGQTIAGIRIADFAITPASPTSVPGRYGIRLNGTSGEIIHALIDHVAIGPVSSYAIEADGSGNAQGTPVLSTVQNSLLYGGLSFASLGDTVRVINNQITGPGYALDAEFQSGGASTLIVSGNNITSAGGIHVGSLAYGVQIVRNEIEAETNFTGSNGAVIDIDGPSAYDVIVQDNSIQIPSAYNITTDAVRINGANSTTVSGNIFQRGVTTSKDVAITSSAQNTFIGSNVWTLGSPLISDSGSTTMIATAVPGAFVLGNGHSLGSFDNTGASYQMLETGTDNSVTLFGYHGQSMVSGVNGATYIYDGSGTNTVAATMSPAGVNVGGDTSTGKVTLDGRGALFLASEAACMATGAGDRFLMWSAGTSQTCQSLCQTISCGGGTASCVQGWTAFTGTQVYRYGDECSSTTNHGNTGKLCCCSGTNCAEPLYQ